jgi:RNA recognition motif-containing protein
MPTHHNPLRVFVANLAYTIDDSELFQFFSRWIDVTAAKITRDADGHSRGFGFVDLRSDDDVARALELDGYLLCQRRIRVQRPRQVK